MRKEEFFEILGELDDKIVVHAKSTGKKEPHWKIWGAMAACVEIMVSCLIQGSKLCQLA